MSNSVQEELKGKNWVATMIFCWSLGSFGAHRFYTGKKSSAWVMLLLTITGFLSPISAVWAVVDGILIALNKYKHADGTELYEYIEWLGKAYIGIIICSIILVALASALVAAGVSFVKLNFHPTGLLPVDIMP